MIIENNYKANSLEEAMEYKKFKDMCYEKEKTLKCANCRYLSYYIQDGKYKEEDIEIVCVRTEEMKEETQKHFEETKEILNKNKCEVLNALGRCEFYENKLFFEVDVYKTVLYSEQKNGLIIMNDSRDPQIFMTKELIDWLYNKINKNKEK